jgi:hypothetical protein
LAILGEICDKKRKGTAVREIGWAVERGWCRSIVEKKNPLERKNEKLKKETPLFTPDSLSLSRRAPNPPPFSS